MWAETAVYHVDWNYWKYNLLVFFNLVLHFEAKYNDYDTLNSTIPQKLWLYAEAQQFEGLLFSVSYMLNFDISCYSPWLCVNC